VPRSGVVPAHETGTGAPQDEFDQFLREFLLDFGHDVAAAQPSKPGARLYANRIRDQLSSYQFAHKRPMTASFGIASLPEDCGPLDTELMLAADEALCRAKRAGKNRIGVFEDISERGRP
jgi:GGDEF domain-containing protein